jgi:hypothetical protein
MSLETSNVPNMEPAECGGFGAATNFVMACGSDLDRARLAVLVRDASPTTG